MQNMNPKTIRATVNTRLLSKAQRLFTGTLEGRVVEVLQNARRAGATEVSISNQDDKVTVTDNGNGIADFGELLNLGSSGWTDGDSDSKDIEKSEDPAGVGLFCLAPRKLVVRSLGHQAVIEDGGWHGDEVEVTPTKTPDQGSTFIFADEPWTFDHVEPFAAYTGMKVVVDGKACRQIKFIDGTSRDYLELGVRIKVVSVEKLPPFCYSDGTRRFSRDQVYVNFFGQVVALDYQPVDRHNLAYLVELTGQPTGIRLMLPARTRLIDNEALAKLKDVIEREAYAYLKARGHHQLPYSQYLRARALGIDLPEADPDYHPGLLSDDGYGMFPVEVRKPEDLKLSACYRMSEGADDDEMSGTANVHLLAAFYKGDMPFVPVNIHPRYNGYRWADLPQISSVTVVPGEIKFEDWVGSHVLVCVDTLKIEVTTDDGKRFSHAVPMAVRPIEADADGQLCHDNELYVTPKARSLRDEDLWYHAGGFSDEGDTWETQLYDFGRELAAYWDQLDGPYESLRKKLYDATDRLPAGWQSVMTLADGTMEIQLAAGKVQTVRPPEVDRVDEGGAS